MLCEKNLQNFPGIEPRQRVIGHEAGRRGRSGFCASTGCGLTGVRDLDEQPELGAA